MALFEVYIDSEPLAFVLEVVDGEGHADIGQQKRVPLSVAKALDYGINILADKNTNRAIKLPGFLKRLMIRAMFDAYRKARLDEFKQGSAVH